MSCSWTICSDCLKLMSIMIMMMKIQTNVYDLGAHGSIVSMTEVSNIC